MKAEDILTLIKAGYTKEEIQAFDNPSDDPSKDEKDEKDESKEPKDSKKPKPEEKEEASVDYAKLSMELVKALAGKDTGYNPSRKSKKEEVDETLFSFVK